MKSQGRSFLQAKNVDERARFVSFVQYMLDRWRYAENGRTWPMLAEQTDISEDQISKWLRGVQVPSKDSVEKLFKVGVFEETPESMIATKPWMAHEPDAGVLKRAASNQEKKKQPTKKQHKKAAPAPVEVAEPEVEVAAPDVYDVIAQLDIPAKAKMQISALVALAEAGGVLDVEVKVRAR